MFITAVTGTNGKTTTVELARQILYSVGFRPASLGTLGVKSENYFESEPVLIGKQAISNLITDLQDYYEINMFLFEAFSSSLTGKLYDNVPVNLALITNLGEDHLDYHKNRKNYMKAKMRLFTHVLVPGGTAIFNSDDDLEAKIRLIGKERNLELFSFGFSKNANLRISHIDRVGLKSIVTLIYDGILHRIELPFTGDCFVLNWLGAVAISLKMDVCFEEILEYSKNLSLPPGRMEYLGSFNQANIFVDFANNEEALTAVLNIARATTKGKLHLVFGCGGEREKYRRSQMGRTAQKLANYVVVTNDNPRNEEASKIRKEILKECPKGIDIADREIAIEYAISCLKPTDVLLITGKGSEKYQEINENKFKFCDQDIVSNFLNRFQNFPNNNYSTNLKNF